MHRDVHAGRLVLAQSIHVALELTTVGQEGGVHDDLSARRHGGDRGSRSRHMKITLAIHSILKQRGDRHRQHLPYAFGHSPVDRPLGIHSDQKLHGLTASGGQLNTAGLRIRLAGRGQGCISVGPLLKLGQGCLRDWLRPQTGLVRR